MYYAKPNLLSSTASDMLFVLVGIETESEKSYHTMG